MIEKENLTEIAHRLAAFDLRSRNVVTGFDGFVDEMITLVHERQSLDQFTPVPDIATFGAIISGSEGHSSLREIVVRDEHPGGCAVNLADGLACMGVAVDCFATLGWPMHSAFSEVAKKCRGFHSWGRLPGRTLAFEFQDGKTMFSSVSQLAEFTVDAVRGFLNDGTFSQACANAQVIALTDWTLYPHMTDVWKMLQREVFAMLSHRPHFFVDLVDPSSRSNADILSMCSILHGFEQAGELTLGLNGNEANILCRLHDLPVTTVDATPQTSITQATALREQLKISRVVIHRAGFAVCSSASSECYRLPPHCAQPLKSTGAGDRFNAGFCLGLSLGFDDRSALALACATAGFFVRHAQSANHEQLVQSLHQWAAACPDESSPI